MKQISFSYILLGCMLVSSLNNAMESSSEEEFENFTTYHIQYIQEKNQLSVEQKRIENEVNFAVKKELQIGYGLLDSIKSNFMSPGDESKVLNFICAKANTLHYSSIGNLYQRNCFINALINKYKKIASSDLEKVTPETLHSLLNPYANQPSKKLNDLPFILRKYVMQAAQAEIFSEYSLNIFSPVPAKPSCSCLSQIADLAAIPMLFENSVVVWNLKTTKHFLLLSKGDVKYLTFSPTGSELLVAGKSKTDTTYIEEWNIANHFRNFAIDLPEVERIADITYLEHHKNRTIVILCKELDDTKAQQLIWVINDNGIPEYKGSILLVNTANIVGYKQEATQLRYTCTTATFGDPAPDLCIKKHNCVFLFLCQNALKMSKNREDIRIITSSIAYSKLTEHEQKIIDKLISEKFPQDTTTDFL